MRGIRSAGRAQSSERPRGMRGASRPGQLGAWPPGSGAKPGGGASAEGRPITWLNDHGEPIQWVNDRGELLTFVANGRPSELDRLELPAVRE
jgi:hypothetical protein